MRYMKRAIGIAVLFSFLALQLGGCTSFRTNAQLQTKALMSNIQISFNNLFENPKLRTKADVGLLSGCISGVIIGGVAGNIPGALAGGILGTIFGTAVGEYLDKKMESREEALLHYPHNADENIFFVRSSSAELLRDPNGSKIKTGVQYGFVASPDLPGMNITEIRMLFTKNNGFITVDERQIFRNQGTYDSTYTFTIPSIEFTGDVFLVTVISNGIEKKTAIAPLLPASRGNS